MSEEIPPAPLRLKPRLNLDGGNPPAETPAPPTESAAPAPEYTRTREKS